MLRKLDAKGFSVVEVVVVLVIVAVLAVSGFLVWQRNKDDGSKKTDTKTSQDQTKEEDNQAKEPDYLSLAEGVRLTLPEGWTYTKGDDNCLGSVTSDVVCREGAFITPGTKLPTRYGNGTEFFYIGVSAFDNSRQSNAQTWIEQDFDAGGADNDDITSREAINGYDAYYWKKLFSGDGTNIEEVNYAFTANDKAVLVHARIYEPGTLNDGTKVGDFRQFESEIAAMSRTIVIE
jgi:prepilin-type N-terminal cleavage/methylation domain-containing protein